MKIPETLKGKLEFGNIKQIEALKELAKDAVLGEYEFTIPEFSTYQIVITARSEVEAYNKAVDMIDDD